MTLPDLSRGILTGVADVTIGLGELKDSVLDGFEGIHAWGAIFDRSQRQQCAPEKATSRESLPHFGEWQAQGRAKTVGDGEHRTLLKLLPNRALHHRIRLVVDRRRRLRRQKRKNKHQTRL